MPNRVEISVKTIFIVLALIAGLWFLYVIQEIILLLFVAFIIMSALRPLVGRLERMGLHRGFTILVLYALLIAGGVLYGSLVFPPLVTETAKLVTFLPDIITKLAPHINISNDTFFTQLAPFGQNVFKVTIGIFSNIISVLTVLVFSFYFLLERDKLTNAFEWLFGKENNKKINRIITKAEERMGGWVRGQFLLMVIVAQFSYIGLALMGISYALPLALIAGVLELFPIIGPNLSAIPAILVGLSISWQTGLMIAILYLIIQQLENNLIVPTVMKRTVGLSPLVSLVALMVGARLAGILGAVLALPMVLLLQTIIEELFLPTKDK